MSFTTYATAVAGSILTAAFWNQQVRDNGTVLKTAHDNGGNLAPAAATTLTLASDACTPTQNDHAVDTEGAAATDNLSTLTIAGNIRAGHLLILTAANSARVVTVKNGVGNITLCGGDYVLDGTKNAVLFLQLIGTTWFEVSRALNNGPSTTVATPGNITALTLPYGSGPLTVYMSNAASTQIQGIAAGLPQQTLTIISTGAAPVYLSHLDAAASAGTKLFNFVTVGMTALAPGSGSATYIYDSINSRWKLLDHEQGAPISHIAPIGVFGQYPMSNIGAAGGGTVSSAGYQISQVQYYVKGRLITVNFTVANLRVSTPASSLVFQIPGGNLGNSAGFQAQNTNFYPAVTRYSDNGALVKAGMAGTSAAGALINVFVDIAGGTWTNTGVNFNTGFEVSLTFPLL
jgi:hypothetical protein